MKSEGGNWFVAFVFALLAGVMLVAHWWLHQPVPAIEFRMYGPVGSHVTMIQSYSSGTGPQCNFAYPPKPGNLVCQSTANDGVQITTVCGEFNNGVVY